MLTKWICLVGLLALLEVTLNCSSARKVETLLIQRKTELEFTIRQDTLEIGSMRTRFKEFRREEKDVEVHEMTLWTALAGLERPMEYSMEKRCRSTGDGVPLSLEFQRVEGEDTLRVEGDCRGDVCFLVITDRDGIRERRVPIDENVRCRLPFERWAFKDRLQVGAEFRVDLLRPEVQGVVESEVDIVALDTMNVRGTTLELYRAEVRDRGEEEAREILWMDVFGALWRAEAQIEGVDVTLERSAIPRTKPETGQEGVE